MSGSQTSELCDSNSDVDLYVYVTDVVPLEVRRRIAAGAAQAEIGNEYWEPGDEWIDRETGIAVDVMFRQVAWIEEQLDRVLRRHQASVGYSTCFWYNVRYSQVLFDRRGWLQNLKNFSDQPYPPELKRAIIAKNFPLLRRNLSSYLHQIELAIARNDPVSVNHRVTALLASYFDVLFAVNELPHPGEKRLIAHALTQCQRVPPRYARHHPIGACISPVRTCRRNFKPAPSDQRLGGSPCERGAELRVSAKPRCCRERFDVYIFFGAGIDPTPQLTSFRPGLR